MSPDEMGADEALLDELPAFPLAAIPPSLGTYAQAAAASIDPDMPADAIALPLLAVVGGLIGNRLALEVKPKIWIEYPSLYVGIIAKSGTAKSAAMKMATYPIRKIEHELDRQHEAAVAAYQSNREEIADAVRQRKLAVKTANNIVPPLPPSLEVPRRRRILTTDSTFEATVANLASTPGMVMMRDEMAGWMGGFDAYRGGRGGDRQQWLQMWSSVDIFVDRKIEGTTKIYSPVMGVVGGIQPSMLPGIQPDPRLVDGFLERIIFTAHRLQVPSWSDSDIPLEVMQDITDVVSALDLLPIREAVPGEPVGTLTTMTRDARVLFRSWYDSVTEIARADPEDAMQSYYSKLRNQCARIMLINHAAWTAEQDPTVPIDSCAVEQAIEIASYLEPHYRAFVSETQRQREVRSEPIIRKKPGPDPRPIPERVLGYLERAGGRLTRSHLLKRMGRTPASDMDAALDVLIASDIIREETIGEGRKATRIYSRVQRGTE